MASPKALAAIALTLIVAAPIILGFAMASEDVETHPWVADGSSNLSNQILNTTTPFFGDYTGPANNSRLYQQWNTQEATEHRQVAPDYNVISTTPSSMPEYAPAASDVSLTEYSTASTNLASSGSMAYAGTGRIDAYGDPSYQFPNADWYHITLTTTSNPAQYWVLLRPSGGQISLSSTSTTFDAVRTGEDSWKVTYTNIAGTTATATFAGDWGLGTTRSGTLFLSYRSYTDLTGTSYSFNTDPNLWTGLRLNNLDGTATYLGVKEEKLVSLNGSVVLVGSDVYNGVRTISAVFAPSYSVLSVTSEQPTGQYADPSYGWKLPLVSTYSIYSWWTNGYQNDSVTMMVSFDSAATISFSPGDIWTHHSTGIYNVAYADGAIQVNNTLLGSYNKVMATFSSSGATFTGITAWPNMYATPTPLNTLTFDIETGTFTGIEMNIDEVDHYDDVSFRVDTASVISGYFPSTTDYTLNMNALFPGKSYTMKFNSVGIFGDTLTVNGVSYTVNNGRILVGDAAIPLKGMTISSRLNNGVYDVSIGSIKVGTSTTPASVTFGGEWSLTVTADFLAQTTENRAEWKPGAFAFDTEAFVGVIVLASAAAFIGVGIYGARSGAKVGLLLLICGGAALIALTII